MSAQLHGLSVRVRRETITTFFTRCVLLVQQNDDMVLETRTSTSFALLWLPRLKSALLRFLTHGRPMSVSWTSPVKPCVTHESGHPVVAYRSFMGFCSWPVGLPWLFPRRCVCFFLCLSVRSPTGFRVLAYGSSVGRFSHGSSMVRVSHGFRVLADGWPRGSPLDFCWWQLGRPRDSH